MAQPKIHYPAVLVSALVMFLIGWAWYDQAAEKGISTANGPARLNVTADSTVVQAGANKREQDSPNRLFSRAFAFVRGLNIFESLFSIVLPQPAILHEVYDGQTGGADRILVLARFRRDDNVRRLQLYDEADELVLRGWGLLAGFDDCGGNDPGNVAEEGCLSRLVAGRTNRIMGDDILSIRLHLETPA